MQMCPLITEVHKDSLALATDTTVTIGRIYKIQKLHMISFWRVSMPRRICYQEETSQHSESSRQGISMSDPIIDEMSLLSPFQA